jgi:hypothetical protein
MSILHMRAAILGGTRRSDGRVGMSGWRATRHGHGLGAETIPPAKLRGEAGLARPVGGGGGQSRRQGPAEAARPSG